MVNDKTLAKTGAEKYAVLQMGHCLERAEQWCQLKLLYYSLTVYIMLFDYRIIVTLQSSLAIKFAPFLLLKLETSLA